MVPHFMNLICCMTVGKLPCLHLCGRDGYGRDHYPVQFTAKQNRTKVCKQKQNIATYVGKQNCAQTKLFMNLGAFEELGSKEV